MPKIRQQHPETIPNKSYKLLWSFAKRPRTLIIIFCKSLAISSGGRKGRSSWIVESGIYQTRRFVSDSTRISKESQRRCDESVNWCGWESSRDRRISIPVRPRASVVTSVITWIIPRGFPISTSGEQRGPGCIHEWKETSRRRWKDLCWKRFDLDSRCHGNSWRTPRPLHYGLGL